MADNEKRSNTPLYLLLALAGLMVAAAVYDFFTVARDSTYDAKFLSLSAQQSLISQSVVPVSYTHLTLPTICSV